MLTPDQLRVKQLLAETITLLCKNGLHFKSEFCINALIGITLDQEDVFLVTINETVFSGETFVRNRCGTGIQSGAADLRFAGNDCRSNTRTNQGEGRSVGGYRLDHRGGYRAGHEEHRSGQGDLRIGQIRTGQGEQLSSPAAESKSSHATRSDSRSLHGQSDSSLGVSRSSSIEGKLGSGVHGRGEQEQRTGSAGTPSHAEQLELHCYSEDARRADEGGREEMQSGKKGMEVLTGDAGESASDKDENDLSIAKSVSNNVERMNIKFEHNGNEGVQLLNDVSSRKDDMNNDEDNGKDDWKMGENQNGEKSKHTTTSKENDVEDGLQNVQMDEVDKNNSEETSDHTSNDHHMRRSSEIDSRRIDDYSQSLGKVGDFSPTRRKIIRYSSSPRNVGDYCQSPREESSDDEGLLFIKEEPRGGYSDDEYRSGSSYSGRYSRKLEGLEGQRVSSLDQMSRSGVESVPRLVGVQGTAGGYSVHEPYGADARLIQAYGQVAAAERLQPHIGLTGGGLGLLYGAAALNDSLYSKGLYSYDSVAKKDKPSTSRDALLDLRNEPISAGAVDESYRMTQRALDANWSNRRQRATFTAYQIERLERAFSQSHYVGTLERAELSRELNINENIIQVWFQNRRQKLKKQLTARTSFHGDGMHGKKLDFDFEFDTFGSQGVSGGGGSTPRSTGHDSTPDMPSGRLSFSQDGASMRNVNGDYSD